jgi:hypothetical protein
MTERAMIRMHTYEPCVLSTQDYERLEREVRGRILAYDAGIGDHILLRLLEEHRPRYFEAKAQNAAPPIDKETP